MQHAQMRRGHQKSENTKMNAMYTITYQPYRNMVNELKKVSESILQSEVVVRQGETHLEKVVKSKDHCGHVIKISRKQKFIIFLTLLLFAICLRLILIRIEVAAPNYISDFQQVEKVARKKILAAFITIGPSPFRNEMLRKNIEIVTDFGRTSKEKYSVECIIFARISRAHVPEFARHPTDCRTVYLFESMFTDAYFYLDPIFLKAGGIDYVILSHDDVYIFPPTGDINLEEYMDMVVSTNLSMSSPAVEGSPHRFMKKFEPPNSFKDSVVGHTVPFVEIQFTSFTMDAWTCIHGLFDLELQFYWYDVFFHEYCFSNGRGVAGVLDQFVAFHNKTKSTYTNKMNHTQAIKKWKELHNETLVNNLRVPWAYKFFDRHGRILSDN
jgi:hypothetical protein